MPRFCRSHLCEHETTLVFHFDVQYQNYYHIFFENFILNQLTPHMILTLQQFVIKLFINCKGGLFIYPHGNF